MFSKSVCLCYDLFQLTLIIERDQSIYLFLCWCVYF